MNKATVQVLLAAVCLWPGVTVSQVSVPSVPAPQETSQLKPDSILPLLTGETVSGRSLNLPEAAAGHTAVVIFSFSRNAGHDAQNWAEHLSKDDPQLPIYSVIFLESVPSIFRSMAISGIRNGMPPAMLDRTLLVFHQQASWQQKLHTRGDSSACVMVLDPSGHIRWIALGPFTGSLYLRLGNELRR